MLALVLLAALEGRPADGEALVALDVREGGVADVVHALAEAAGLQAVLDPDGASSSIRDGHDPRQGHSAAHPLL